MELGFNPGILASGLALLANVVCSCSRLLGPGFRSQYSHSFVHSAPSCTHDHLLAQPVRGVHQIYQGVTTLVAVPSQLQAVVDNLQLPSSSGEKLLGHALRSLSEFSSAVELQMPIVETCSSDLQYWLLSVTVSCLHSPINAS